MTLADLLRTAAQAIAVLLAAARYVVGLLGRVEPFPPEGLRLGLGRSLALALEFLLGADILRTAVEPSWDEIGRLAAIAAIRTALNYFLQREIAQDARQAHDAHVVDGQDVASPASCPAGWRRRRRNARALRRLPQYRI